MIQFDKITDQIFVGTCPKTIEDINHLKRNGINAVLNLQTDQDLIENEIHWPTLRQAYQQNDLIIKRTPIIDFDEEDFIRLLSGAISTLKDLINSGRTVYVHCTAGRERSPSTVTAYLAWQENMGLEKALEMVRAARERNPYLDALKIADKLHTQSL